MSANHLNVTNYYENKEQYKVYFERLSGSALSLVQQKLLLEQIITEFTQDNALNLYMNLINIISKQNKPIDNALLKQIIQLLLSHIF